MEIEEVKRSMKKSFETKVTDQSVIDKHLIYIEELLLHGYKMPSLLEILGLKMNIHTFRTLIKRARNKKKEEKNIPKLNSVVPNLHSPSIDDNNWKKLYHDIGSHLIKHIVELGFTPNDVKKWKQELSIITVEQLRKHVNKLKEEKASVKYK